MVEIVEIFNGGGYSVGDILRLRGISSDPETVRRAGHSIDPALPNLAVGEKYFFVVMGTEVDGEIIYGLHNPGQAIFSLETGFPIEGYNPHVQGLNFTIDIIKEWIEIVNNPELRELHRRPEVAEGWESDSTIFDIANHEHTFASLRHEQSWDNSSIIQNLFNFSVSELWYRLGHVRYRQTDINDQNVEPILFLSLWDMQSTPIFLTFYQSHLTVSFYEWIEETDEIIFVSSNNYYFSVDHGEIVTTFFEEEHQSLPPTSQLAEY